MCKPFLSPFKVLLFYGLSHSWKLAGPIESMNFPPSYCYTSCEKSFIAKTRCGRQNFWGSIVPLSNNHHCLNSFAFLFSTTHVCTAQAISALWCARLPHRSAWHNRTLNDIGSTKRATIYISAYPKRHVPQQCWHLCHTYHRWWQVLLCLLWPCLSSAWHKQILLFIHSLA